MNGDKPTSTVTTNAAEQADSPEKTTTTAASPKQGSSALAVITALLLLCLLLAMAAGGYYGWRYWQAFSTQQEQRLQALENNASEQRAQLSRLSQTQSGQTSEQLTLLQQVQADQQRQQQRLDSHNQRLSALAGTSRDDWLLAEARYLLRLAGQRLLVENSTESAQRLLASADAILQSVDDAGVLPVRDAIAKEVIALKLANTIDRQGIYLQIAALKQQIQQLPLIPFQGQTTGAALDDSNSDEDSASKPTSAWASLQQALGHLSQFVKVRQYDQTPDLLISEQQQLRVLNNIGFAFEQAQFALLHEQVAIYRESLDQAGQWWQRYYAHYPEHAVIANELKKLQAMDIVQVIPSIARSSELLSDYIERFHQLTPPAPVVDEAQSNSTEESSP